MARIQVLRLPAERVGDVRQTPFALIIDRVTPPPEDGFVRDIRAADWRDFRDACGARAILITEDTVELG